VKVVPSPSVLLTSLTLIEDSFKNQQISIEVVAKDDPIIFGYPNEYAQVLLNILNNASDALKERGSNDPRVTITIGTEGDRAVAAVSDKAGGIPEEIMSKIFETLIYHQGAAVWNGSRPVHVEDHHREEYGWQV
jgi:C4-dicarboxylate-specific signal transduction histidine kinase